MMARRAAIHIGTFKTGSTSIQAFLDRNAAVLARQGVYFPKAPGRPNHHGLAIYALSHRETTGLIRYHGLLDREKREAKRAEIAAALRAELEALPATITTVVFSNEHLSGLHRVSEVEELRDLLAPYFEKIDIIVYLRRQDQRIISDYTQKVRDGHAERLDLQDYKPSEGLDLLAFLDKWAGVFGADALKPRVFSREAFTNGDLIEDFMEAAGIEPDQGFLKPQIENAGLSHEAIHFLRAFNGHVPQYVDGERNPLRMRLLPYLAEAFAGAGIQVGKGEVEKLLARVSENNAAAAEKYFGRTELFSDDVSRYEESDRPEPVFEDAVRIAAALWVRQAEHIEALKSQLAALRVSVIANSEQAKALAERILDSDEDRESYYPTLLEVFSSLHAELREARRLLALARGGKGVAAEDQE